MIDKLDNNNTINQLQDTVQSLTTQITILQSNNDMLMQLIHHNKTNTSTSGDINMSLNQPTITDCPYKYTSLYQNQY